MNIERNNNLLSGIEKILLVFLGLFLLASNIFAADNLLKNGSFEKPYTSVASRPSFWSIEKYSDETVVAYLRRTEDAYAGEFAAKILMKKSLGGEQPRASILSQAMDVNYGLYILKGWYKTSGKCKAGLKYTTIDVTGIKTRSYTKELSSVNEWTEFTLPVNVRDHYKISTGYLKKYDVERISIELLAFDEGEIFFDNVSLIKSDDSIVPRLFPAEYREDGKLPLVIGTPNYLRIMISGEKEKVTDRVKIELDMPEGTDDYGVFGGGELVITDGQKCFRYYIDVPKSEVKQMKEITSHASVTCWFNISNIKENQKVFYRVVIGDKKLTPKEAQIKILPQIPDGLYPKKFDGIVSWATFGDTHKGTITNNYMPEKIFPDVYKLIRNMGINSYMIFGHKENGGWREYFLNNIKKDGGKVWANIPRGFYKNFHGKGWETKVINGGVDGIAQMCGDYYHKIKNVADAVHFDFEPSNAKNNPLWEHTPTRKMFAAKYGYDLSTLTTKRLKGELREKWLSFRTWQLGEALRLWAKYVHTINPNWEITVSQGDGYPMDKYIDYGVYNDIPHIVHMPQIYLGSSIGLARNVIALREHFPNDTFFPVITSYMVADKGWPAKVTPSNLYSKNISLAMLGCMGVAQWPDIRRGMDMEYIWEISRAMRDITYLEDYVFDGKVLDNVTFKINGGNINWEENSLARAYKLEGKILIAFNNMNTNNSADVKVSLKNMEGNNWEVVDPLTNKIIESPNGKTWNNNELENYLIYKIPASTLGMLIIKQTEIER